jgi:hypothetical protein
MSDAGEGALRLGGVADLGLLVGAVRARGSEWGMGGCGEERVCVCVDLRMQSGRF